MTFYYISEQDIASIHLLLVLNLANLFIMFFMFFIFIEKHYTHNPIIINNTNQNDDLLRHYRIYLSDLYEIVTTVDFPYENRCSICLEDFELHTDVVKTVNCSHYFHEACLKRWLQINPTCPYCNVNIAARSIENDN